MEPRHALQHVRELRSRIGFLRPMRPDGPTYKLWLGDVVEAANAIWGAGSPETARIADALRANPAREGDEAGRRYLRRLESLDEVLAEYERQLGGQQT